VKITFEVENRSEAMTMMHAGELLSVINDIFNMARNHLKHNEFDSGKETLEHIKQLASSAMERVE
jgi:hypothetical protein